MDEGFARRDPDTWVRVGLGCEVMSWHREWLTQGSGLGAGPQSDLGAAWGCA